MNKKDLQKAYASSQAVAAICDELGARQRNQKETKLRRIISILEQKSSAPPKKHELIAAFRKLQDAGVGKYTEGRRGHPSRFEWAVGSLDACRVAQGEEVEASPVEFVDSQSEDDQEAGILDHYFNLREDYQLEIQLPVDLSKEEAERLATYVRSLPLEDYQ